MNKKVTPPLDIDKLIVDCRKELMKYECKVQRTQKRTTICSRNLCNKIRPDVRQHFEAELHLKDDYSNKVI